MFRFETIVGIVIVFSGQSAFADGLSDLFKNAGNNPVELHKYMTQIGCFKKPIDEDLKAQCADLKTSFSNKECDDLKALKEKAKNARDELRKSCGPAGLDLHNDDGAGVECSQAIERCWSCSSKVSAADAKPGLCKSSDSSDDEKTPEGGVNIGRLRHRADNCPALAQRGQKEYDKSYKDARKDIKDAEKRANEAQKKATEARNKGEDEKATANDKMVKAQQDLDQKLGEAEEKYKQSKKEIAAQIVQLQQQIAQADDAIRQLTLQKADAETEYNNAITAIEMKCYEHASNVVSKMQQDRLSRPFNRGNFQNMMKQVGLSDRASWKREADKYYRYCMASAPTKASKRSAKRGYDSALRKADGLIAGKIEEKNRLAAQQLQLQNGVCDMQSGTQITAAANTESDSCSAAKTAMADAQRAHRAFEGNAYQAQVELAKAQKKADSEAAVHDVEAAQAKREVADERERMKNMRRALEILDKDADTVSDPKAYDRAIEKYGEFRTAARTYVDCRKNNKNDCDTDPDCKQYKRYFKSIEQEVVDVVDTRPPPVSSESKSDGAAPAGRSEHTDLNKPAGSTAK